MNPEAMRAGTAGRPAAAAPPDLGDDLDAQLDLERDMMRELGRSADYAEGVVAFLDKRAPVFQGR